MEPKSKQNPNPNQKRSKCPYEYCHVCRRNHDQGRRHRYFPSHCAALSAALSRFSGRIVGLRRLTPASLRPDESSRFWCMFCSEEIIDTESLFNWRNAMNHLASEKHLKCVKEFLWKHGVGSNHDRVDQFRVSESELSKWEKDCEALKKESEAADQEGAIKDIQNENIYKNRDNYENNNFIDSFNPNVMPLQSATNLKSQDIYNSDLAGSSFPVTAHNDEKRSNGGGAPSTIANRMVKGIGPKEDSSNDVTGNIHTRAPPPWLEPTELSLNPKNDKSLNQNPKKEKSSKLNPKRVGAAWAEKRRAELARENNNYNNKKDDQFGENWLPNFGRVWQAGTRKESKKEFGKLGFKKRGGENIGEMEVQIKPYTSKRLRVDLSKEEGTG